MRRRQLIVLTPLTLDLTDTRGLEQARIDYPLDESTAAATSPPKSSEQAADSIRADEATPSGAVSKG